MISKVLTKASVHNAKHNIRNCAKISFIILALHILSMPSVLINIMYNISSGKSISSDDAIVIIAMIMTFAAGLCGILIALMNFRYLYSKPQVDMCLSQPMTRMQRFFSDYFSGLISYILPFAAAEIITGIILSSALIFMEGKTYIMYRRTVPTEYVCDIFGQISPLLFRVVVIGILMMFMLYTMTVLVAACCGSLFESVLYTVFVNCAVPASAYMLYSGYFSNIHGVYTEPFFADLMALTSPAGGVIELAYNAEERETMLEYGGYWGLPLGLWALGYILITLLMLAGAYFLYMKRKAEQVSKPFVFKGVYYTVLTLFTFCITALFIHEGDEYYFAPLIIITFVVYMLLEVVSRRGFRKIWTGIIRYVITVAVCMGFSGLCEATGYFGIENKVPDVSSVSEIHIGYNGIYTGYNEVCGSFSYYKATEEEREALNVIKLTSQENIRAVAEAHRIITEKRNLPENEMCAAHISVCYVYKNGGRLVRNYDRMPAEALKVLSSVDVSSEFKTQYASYARKFCEAAYDGQLRAWASAYNMRMPYIIVTPLRSYEEYHAGKHDYQTSLEREFFSSLGEALEKDILALPAESYFRPSSPTGFVVSVPGVIPSGSSRVVWGTFTVTKDFRETMKLLYSCGYIESYDFSDMEDYFSGLTNAEIKIIPPAENSPFIMNTNRYDYGRGKFPGERYVLGYSPELEELYKVMYRMYNTDAPCYTMLVEGGYYTVPPEYSSLAEKVYAKAAEKPEDADDDLYYFNGKSGYDR